MPRSRFSGTMIRGIMEGASKYRFGPFELHARARQFSKNGVRIKLRGQPYLILELLLSRPGEIVTREEIRNRLWPADTFVDFEHGLNTSVKKLRQVLCDSVEEPRYIETEPRLGYRFIAPVEIVADGTASNPAIPAVGNAAAATASDPPATVLVSPEAPLAEPVRQHAPVRWKLALTLIMAVGLALAGWFLTAAGKMPWHTSRSTAGAVASRHISSIAVLPLESLSNDPSQDYFTDGMTDELISDLAQLGSLRVISRTSAMHYKGANKTVPEIGRELGVDALVEGTVERVADRVRIRVQLIDTATDRHLWARSYDHEFKDVLLLQSTAARDIVEEIQGKIVESQTSSQSANTRTIKPEAYEAFLKGRYFWNKRTAEGFKLAIEYFQRAIRQDPGYPAPYGALAESYALLGAYGTAPEGDSMAKARVAARKALDLDSQLPEAHTALGYIAENYDWDWKTAEAEYRRAIELNPNYATAHQWYAECLALQGRFDEAFPEIERARRLDPLSLIIATDDGVILYFSRQYDRAIEQLRGVLEMEPDFPRAHMLIYAYVEKGMFSEALDLIEKWRHPSDSPWSWATLAYVYGRSGDSARAQTALRNLQQSVRRASLDPLTIGEAYLAAGDKERALTYLELAHAKHSGGLTALKVDPIFDALHSDPRYVALVRSIGLVP